MEKQLPELMTIKETAGYLRMSERQLFRKMRAGQIRACRIGKTVRFKRKEVEIALDRMLDESIQPPHDAAMG